MFVKLAFSLSLIALAGCQQRPPAAVSEKPAPYAVPVSIPCIATSGRPDKPQTLAERYTDAQWAALPPGAKANAVSAQAGAHLNYEDKEAAATAGCK